MTALQVAPSAPVPRRGRGLVIAGSVLLAVSVLGAVVGAALTVGRVDFSDLDREVVYRSGSTSEVPGLVRFSVAEPLPGTATKDMTVGVATTPVVPVPTCTLATASGEPVRLRTNVFDSSLSHDDAGRFSVVGTARLAPGDYEARCTLPGEPSKATGEFTVGRTLGSDEVGDMVVPAIAFLGVLGLTGLTFVVGVVLVVVGLVLGRRPRADGPPPSVPPLPAPPAGPPPYEPPRYEPPRYEPPPSPQPPTYEPPAPGGPDDAPRWPTPPGQG